MQHLLVGQIFDDKYELLEILGAGAIGIVYKARQIDCDRIVALKVLQSEISADDEFRKRFLLEARALSQISHKNIVSVYFLGQATDGSLYLVMEYIRGTTLQSLMNERRLAFSETLNLISALSSAVSAVHAVNIVHRDIKPANILLLTSPEEITPKLIDFGLIRVEEAVSQKLTATGMLIGTPHYMSPEQCKGNVVDLRSDIYAMCVCFYEMLTGKRPYEADSVVGLMYQHINAPVPELSDEDSNGFADEINEIMQLGMAKDPKQRFQKMDDFQGAIDALRKLSENSRTRHIRKQAFTVAVPIIAAVLFAGLVGAGIFVYSTLKKNSTEGQTFDYIRSSAKKQVKTYDLNSIALKVAVKQGRVSRDPLRRLLFLQRALLLSKDKSIQLDDFLRDYASTLVSSNYPEKSQLVCEKEIERILTDSSSQTYPPEVDEDLFGTNDKLFQNFIHLMNVSSRILNMTNRRKEATELVDKCTDQKGLLSRNGVAVTLYLGGMLEDLLREGLFEKVETILKSTNSPSVAERCASICLSSGQYKLAHRFIDIGLKSLKIQSTDDGGLGLVIEYSDREDLALAEFSLRLLDARLAFEEDHLAVAKDKLKYCITHYRGIMTKHNRGKEKELLESFVNTLAMIGEPQLVIDTLRTVYSSVQPAYRKKIVTESFFEKEEKHQASKLVASINKDPDHFLDYVEYAVKSPAISADDRANFLLEARLVEKVPPFCALPVSALSYHYSADSNVSQLTKIKALENYCLRLYEDKLSSQAIRHNFRLIEVAKTAERSDPKLCLQNTNDTLWALSNIVAMYLERNDFKNAKKAFAAIPSEELLASAGSHFVIDQACSLGGENLVRKMIKEAKALPVLGVIIHGCRRTQQFELWMASIQKARLLIDEAQLSQAEKDFYRAHYDLSEIINILEMSRYSKNGIDKSLPLLQPLIKRVLALQINSFNKFTAADSPNAPPVRSVLNLFRETAIAALDCGRLSEASKLNARADLIEESVVPEVLPK